MTIPGPGEPRHELYRWIQLILTNVCSLVAAYFLFSSTNEKTASEEEVAKRMQALEEYRTLMDRVKAQDELISKLYKQVDNMTVELNKVRVEQAVTKAKA